jgi:regulatory protein
MDPEGTKTPRLTPRQALVKIEAYCAYRERSQVEVRQKLYDYGLYPPDVEQIIVKLIESNFLNEQRFACAFVRGKFNQQQWGRVKIKQALYQHKLSPYLLKKAMAEIDEADYQETLERVVLKKYQMVKAKNEFERKGKVAAYVISRGFEGDVVWGLLKTYS